jgi:8-oxo-dGTP diphosphatase
VIQRGREPGRGLWSIPGGRLDVGETARQAAAREVREETGLKVEVGRLLGRVDRPGPGRTVYQIDDFACTVVGGRLTAGSDAADARWVLLELVPTLPLVAGLLEALREWAVLGPPRPRHSNLPDVVAPTGQGLESCRPGQGWAGWAGQG